MEILFSIFERDIFCDFTYPVQQTPFEWGLLLKEIISSPGLKPFHLHQNHIGKDGKRIAAELLTI